MSVLRVLFLGDVVGEPGRKAVVSELSRFRAERGVDFIIVNGENSAGGRGITGKIADELFAAGADVVTTGDHVWDQKDVLDYFPKQPRLIRPLNYPADTVGQGSVVIKTEKGDVAVLQVQGRTFMQPPLENPFLAAEAEIETLHQQGIKIIFCEIHAETTSEKIAMGRCLDGKASVVVGTHTHVQTADERIFPGGTGFLCDAGMCGPDDSVLGRSIESVVWRFKSAMPTRFPIAKGPVRLCGLIADICTETGHCLHIERVSHWLEDRSQGESAEI